MMLEPMILEEVSLGTDGIEQFGEGFEFFDNRAELIR